MDNTAFSGCCWCPWQLQGSPRQCVFGGMSSWSGAPIHCVASRKDIKPPKLQTDVGRGQCDTAPWLRELCLSSCEPLAHLVAKLPSPVNPHWAGLALVTSGWLITSPTCWGLSIILGLHQSALLRLDESFISLSHHLPFLFVPGVSWSSPPLLAAKNQVTDTLFYRSC